MNSTVSQRESRANQTRFRTIEPKILYFGAPVALVSSLNEDGSTDLVVLGAGMDADSWFTDTNGDRRQFCSASRMRRAFAKPRDVAESGKAGAADG